MAENGSEENRRLRPICDLMGKNFVIPHYQRGYRWEEQEVTELLDDLWAFNNDPEGGDFYCLQPIVLLEKGDGSFDVLDGQQRLTTLYLILVYLEHERNEHRYLEKLFTLNYETREECHTFLEGRNFTKGIDSSNIDFYHICNAYQYIDKWFKEEKNRGAKIYFVPLLLNKTEKGKKNVRVIYYEIKEKTNPIDVFIRLNVGKIPLTDSELTKALLLQSDKYPKGLLDFYKLRLHNIASEWDIAENTLQEPAFWYFLNDGRNEKDSHIEFIFDLLANKINAEKEYFKPKPRKYSTFLIFSEYLKDILKNEKMSMIEAVEKIWGEVMKYFEYFKNWFQDRKLYHYIGFLIFKKGNTIIDTYIEEANKLEKSKFLTYLEQEIAEIVEIKKPLDQLVYKDENGRQTSDYDNIRTILLLHNIYTTLKSENEKPRFPFEHLKKQEWSLEHIHAQNSEIISKEENRITWLEDHIKSLRNTDETYFKEEILKMEELSARSEKITDKEFIDIETEVFKKINEHPELKNEKADSISNLCLLDKKTNSTLNNSVFDVKREKIKKCEIEGNYIPICTRNVFLKAYTNFPKTNAYWGRDDRKDYFLNIKKTYDRFAGKLKD